MKRRLPLVRVQPLAYSRQLRQSVLFRLQDVYHARIIAARRERPEKSNSRSPSERSALPTHQLLTFVWLLRRLSSLNAWADRVPLILACASARRTCSFSRKRKAF